MVEEQGSGENEIFSVASNLVPRVHSLPPGSTLGKKLPSLRVKIVPRRVGREMRRTVEPSYFLMLIYLISRQFSPEP